jgi:diguanylate cyclase (GGDEF)-like protein/PAS domain S-box-containing protein
VAESIGDACLVVSRDGTVLSANLTAQGLYFRTHDELVGCHISELCPAGECETLLAEIAANGGQPRTFQALQTRGDSTSFIGDFSAKGCGEPDSDRVVLIVREAPGLPVPLVNDLLLRTLMLDHVSDGIVCHTLEGRLLFANHAMLHMWGLESFAAATHLGPFGWVMRSEREHLSDVMEAMAAEGSALFECHGITVGGHDAHLEVNSKIVESENGQIVVSSVRDISDRLASDEMVRYLAYHDTLTGLANRVLLDTELIEAIAVAESDQHTVGLIYLDLNHFKPINDTLGHAVGDEVLREVANRISGCVRETDVVSRPGGDEFVVLLPRVRRPEDLYAIAEKIADDVSAPMVASGHTIEVTASVGFAFHQPGEDPESFMIRADLAMYEMRRTESARE